MYTILKYASNSSHSMFLPLILEGNDLLSNLKGRTLFVLFRKLHKILTFLNKLWVCKILIFKNADKLLKN